MVTPDGLVWARTKCCAVGRQCQQGVLARDCSLTENGSTTDQVRRSCREPVSSWTWLDLEDEVRLVGQAKTNFDFAENFGSVLSINCYNDKDRCTASVSVHPLPLKAV